MRRATVLLTAMVAMVVAYAGAALGQVPGSETLDANTLGLGESVNAYGFFPGVNQAQTFTAEHDGQLTRAELKIHLDSCCAPIEGLKVNITTVDPATGLPTSNVLASATIPAADIPLLPVNVDPSSIPLTTVTFENAATVVAGEQYAIVLDAIASDTQFYVVRWTTTLQEYSGGQGMWVNDNGSFGGFLPERGNASDQVFATYVTLPGPTGPTSKDDCKNGGYESFGFKNQGQCIKAVNHAS